MALSDDEVCDYPFSIRIPKSMAMDINRRAAAEGMKSSAWARKALEYSLYEMGSDERRISAASLIELIKYDPEVRTALSDMFTKIQDDMTVPDEDDQMEILDDDGYFLHRKPDVYAEKASRNIVRTRDEIMREPSPERRHRDMC